MKPLRLWASLTLMLGTIVACSSPSSKIAPQPATENQPPSLREAMQSKTLEESILDIEYFLERDRYRLSFKSTGEHASIELYHDGKITQKAEINPTQCVNFLKKTTDAMKAFQTESSNPLPCLNPFIVTLRSEKVTNQVKGCRSRDNGNLSKLIREGEFLLYSKNP